VLNSTGAENKQSILQIVVMATNVPQFLIVITYQVSLVLPVHSINIDFMEAAGIWRNREVA
jgi:hypothetical protein